ncbi:MAG: GTP cyclohydrolase II [Sandaracinus sp.]
MTPREPHQVAPVRREVRVEMAAAAQLPTQFGDFRCYVFRNDRDGTENVAMVRGDVFGATDVPTRLHSECLTGDVMGSLRCDCRAQLERALADVGAMPRGIVLYLRQEGRGIGLANKIRAYALQEQGMDTVDANLALGFRDDEREYDIAAGMLRTLGVRSVAVMTNNPDKIRQLEGAGIVVSRRIPHEIPAGKHNRHYLETKARRAGHLLELRLPEPPSAA